MTARVTHLIVGPPEHGVTRFGIELVGALRDNGFDDLAHTSCDDGGVHVQFTDRLYGNTPEQAAGAICALIDQTHRRGQRVTATLHDLPQPSDGTNAARRRAAYGDVVAALDGLVVNSEHERRLLAEAGLAADAVAVVPLPVTAAAAQPPPPADARTVGVFGFLYPGKGHAEVIAALDGWAPDVEVVALGAPSAGHAELADSLRDDCTRRARPFRITGHLPDAEVATALRAVTVPVTPHRHVSASGSLNSWIGAGRRPLAPGNRYTWEFHARNPDAVLLYPDTPTGLRGALERALADPATTWIPAGTTCVPSPAEAARRYAALLQGWHR
ncbi:hypothetical protein ACN27E_16765 [Mycobacterium sp. WMMD1722]|uniref:hypothetical protein n=1 Tax=Mycobacterium sp. WMMD1722 TaxID=3404117 RepID=UPI003BF5F36A